MKVLRSRVLAPLVLLVLAAALVTVGVVLWTHPRERSGGTAESTGLSNSATSQVVSQVSTALNEVLSYSYKDTAPNRAAAAKWLTGDAVAQYQTLFTQLQNNAPGQKLTLVAKVVDAGVVSGKDDSAQLLVFVDQKSTRASDSASSIVAAQVRVQAVHSGDLWRISELKVL